MHQTRSFLCAHEADHHSTACFHKRDAWLCFALHDSEYDTKSAWNFGSAVFTTARLCGEASRGTCHMRWAPISKWYVSRVLQHPLRRRFRSSQGSWCPYFTRNPQLLPPDLHQRLLAGYHMKLLVHQAPHLHHQRRLPRPRHSTRFLKSLPSLYKQKSHSQV